VSGVCTGKVMRRGAAVVSKKSNEPGEQAFTGVCCRHPIVLARQNLQPPRWTGWNTPLHCALSAARGGSLQEDWMRSLALALAAALAVGLSSPSLVNGAAAAQGLKMAQADVRVNVGGPHRSVKKVVVHRDRGLHRGWRHSRHYGATKKVVIKRTGDRVVKKTVITR
jgi:hypothetical protein